MNSLRNPVARAILGPHADLIRTGVRIGGDAGVTEGRLIGRRIREMRTVGGVGLGFSGDRPVGIGMLYQSILLGLSC
jgi:hypothetical protein